METITKIDFKPFGQATNKQLNNLFGSDVYIVDAKGEDIWEHYLQSFPEGTNPIYKERTEHDCQCCKQFVKNLGGLVAIKNGKLNTIWETDIGYPYTEVASEMHKYISSLPILNVFTASQSQYGAVKTFSEDGDATITWDHFHGKVPVNSVGEQRHELKTLAGVFERGLNELSIDSLEQISSLIQNNLIYRGEEFKTKVLKFSALKGNYDKLKTARAKHLFVWKNILNQVAGFRNTVIGTLAQDISSGESLDVAVGKFESKVAPLNYKRSKSLITPQMVDNAVKKLEELGLEPFPSRRHAKFEDMSINDVLFVDNSVESRMKDSTSDLLSGVVKKSAPNFKNAPEVAFEDFIESVLPAASSVEVCFDGDMEGNLMSITAPEHDADYKLFRWDNNFSWSYNGNVTDSIKQKVKNAGGDVDCIMRTSLSWRNHDDLDIHVKNGYDHIYYGRKTSPCLSYKLDVDMNVAELTRDPVENVRWKNNIPNGNYTVEVNNFFQRESTDTGYEIEFEFNGEIHNFYSPQNPAHSKSHTVLTFEANGGKISKIKAGKGIITSSMSKEVWGIQTNSTVKVQSVVMSPNHWGDNGDGNKHCFFILEDCKNPEPTRGIYNEYLRPEMNEHRKVFEILADKTKCPVTEEQMSGLGFSSTIARKVKVTVNNRPYVLTFGK